MYTRGNQLVDCGLNMDPVKYYSMPNQALKKNTKCSGERLS